MGNKMLKEDMKYVKISILSILLILPLASALEQSCQMNINASALLNVTRINDSLNITMDNFNYVYNSSINFSAVNTISLMRNSTCTINVTEGNVSSLWLILYNVSKSTEIIAKDSADRASYFNLYSNCLTNLSSCYARLNISESKQDFEQQYKTCANEKITIEADRNSASNNLASCTTQKSALEKDNESKNTNLAIAFAIGAALASLVIWNWKVKPKFGTDSLHKEAQHYE